MGKIATYLLAGVVVGVGFAWWQGIGQTGAGIGSGAPSAEGGSLEARLGELETEISLERFERQVLADELTELRAAIDALPAGVPVDFDANELREQFENLRDPNNPDNPVSDRIRERFPNGIPQTREEREAFQRQEQINRYVAAGLTPDRAQWIMNRENELEMEVLRARYEATQNDATQQEIANINASSILRKELGDADYAKYLEGQGRPTSIYLREVLSNSPAQTAGLQPGDEIVSYNGQRVFDMGELNALTYETRPGTSVAMQVVRDGQTLQVVVESGPIGISGGGSRGGDRGGGGSGRAGGRSAPPGGF
jgi:membrane-associated protease RseP (regulator of RpoE activity)